MVLIGAISLLVVQVVTQKSEPEAAPEPYAFSYSAESQGGFSTHNESRDERGKVRGFYTILGEDGRERRVDYEADENGYRANVSTNEIGTRSGPTGNARYFVSPPSQGQLDAAKISADQYQFLEISHQNEREFHERAASRLTNNQLFEPRRQQAALADSRWQVANSNQVALPGRTQRQALGQYEQQEARAAFAGSVKTLLPGVQTARNPQGARLVPSSLGASVQPIATAAGSSGDNYFASKFQQTSSGSYKTEKQPDDNDVRQPPVWLATNGQRDSESSRQELPAIRQEPTLAIQPPAASGSSQFDQQPAVQTLAQLPPRAHQPLAGGWQASSAAQVRPEKSFLQRQLEQQFSQQLAEPDYPRQLHIDESDAPALPVQQVAQQEQQWKQPVQQEQPQLWRPYQQQAWQAANQQVQQSSAQVQEQSISSETPEVPTERPVWLAQQLQKPLEQTQGARKDYAVETVGTTKAVESEVDVDRPSRLNQETTFRPSQTWPTSSVLAGQSEQQQQQQWVQQTDLQIQQVSSTVRPDQLVTSLPVQSAGGQQTRSPSATTASVTTTSATRAPWSSTIADLWRGPVNTKPAVNNISWQAQDQISGSNTLDLGSSKRPLPVTQAPLLVYSGNRTTMSQVELAEKPTRSEPGRNESEPIRQTITGRPNLELPSATSATGASALRLSQKGTKGGSRLAPSSKQFWRQTSVPAEPKSGNLQVQQARSNWTGPAQASAAFGYRVSGAAVASQA